MPFASVDARLLHYQESGKGRPLLLLHGFPFTSESFWPQLESPPPGVRVIAIDHRGFGRSTPVAGVASMEALAEDALGLLDALGLEEASVAGVSMGGYVALALARLAPQRVTALALLDSQAHADDEAGRARREAVAQEADTQGMGPLVASMMPRLFGPTASLEIKARLEGIMRGVNPHAAAAASRGMALRLPGFDVLQAYDGPVLVVVGEHDALTPREKAEAMVAAARQARLEVIPGAGHLAHLEAPARVGQLLEELVLGA